MTKPPLIALRRRSGAIARFTKKVEVFEALLDGGDSEKLPKRVSVSGFAEWEDSSLGVETVSRSIIYDESGEYLSLQVRMHVALERLIKLRAKTGKKAKSERSLNDRLVASEARAQDYVNQYSNVNAELADARQEIERLRGRLARLTARDKGVTVLRSVDSGSGPRKKVD